MVTPVLCLVSLALLLWVLLLKSTITELQQKLSKVEFALEKKLGGVTGIVEVHAGKRSKGKKREPSADQGRSRQCR